MKDGVPQHRMLAVKIGASRQVVIPKRAYAALGLAVGDYLEVVVRGDSLVMTPKTLVDKSTITLASSEPTIAEVTNGNQGKGEKEDVES